MDEKKRNLRLLKEIREVELELELLNSQILGIVRSIVNKTIRKKRNQIYKYVRMLSADSLEQLTAIEMSLDSDSLFDRDGKLCEHALNVDCLCK